MAKTIVTYRLPIELVSDLNGYSKGKNISESEVITEALSRFLKAASQDPR